MANKPAQRRAVSIERKKRAAASRRTEGQAQPPPPISLAGIGELPTADLEPGTPDPDDVADSDDSAETARPTERQTAIDPTLAAGDVDASFHGLDSGEEAPGGSDPTPDQDNVDEIGTALGVVEPDEQPLAMTERIAARDERRWELDPASSEDFEEREESPPPRAPRPR
jgi:hypothetical protein